MIDLNCNEVYMMSASKQTTGSLAALKISQFEMFSTHRVIQGEIESQKFSEEQLHF